MASRGGTVDPDWRVCICLDGFVRGIEVGEAARYAGFEVIVATDAVDLRARIDGSRPTLVVLTDAIGGWLRVVHDLRRTRPCTRVLLVTDLDDRLELLTALNAGVDGIARHRDSTDAVVASLAGLSRTGASLPRSLTRELVDEVRTHGGHLIHTPHGDVRVTDREWEILQLLLQGLSTKEMAMELYVAVGTVRSHVSALLGKLGVRTRSEAVALVESS